MTRFSWPGIETPWWLRSITPSCGAARTILGVALSGSEVIATWTARKQGRLLAITLDPLGAPLDRRTRDAIGDEATLLAPLRGCVGTRVEVAD